MGSVQATETQQVASAFNSTVNSVINSAAQTAGFQSATINNINVTVGGAGCPPIAIGGNVNISQAQSSNFTVTSENLQNVTNNVKTHLASSLNSWITNNLQSYNGWLSFALSAQVAGSNTQDDIVNMIVNSISNNATQACSTQLITQNGINLTLCANVTGNVDVDQNTAITASESCINKQIANTIISNSVINSIVQQTNNHFLAQNQGLGDIFYYIIIAAVIIFIFLVIAGVYKHYSTEQAKIARDNRQQQEDAILLSGNGYNGMNMGTPIMTS